MSKSRSGLTGFTRRSKKADDTPRSESGGWHTGSAAPGDRNRDYRPRPGEDTSRHRRDSLGRQT